jgi:branched-chain amino acid transport system substrate-binding protein
MKSSRHLLGAAGLAGMLALAAGSAAAQDKEIVIGLQCDRTGATQIVGTTICPAYHDYVGLEQQGRRRGLQDQGARD